MATLSILYQLSKEDESYINLLKGPLGNSGAKIALNSSTPTTLTEVFMRMKEKKCNCIVTSEPRYLQLLLGRSGAKLPSLDDYAGNIFVKNFMGQNVEILILPPVRNLVAVPYGKFLFARYMSKFLQPAKWLQLPEFIWTVFDPKYTDSIIDTFNDAAFIAVDIETSNVVGDRVITCVGMTAIYIHKTGRVEADTIVFPFDSLYNHAVIATLLQLPCPKVFQNGKYDNAYLLRFNLPACNWAGDTLNLFHSWLSELPKDLAFISSFTLRQWQYWKDESQTSDLMEYYRYNAKDCFATAMSWISLVLEVPDYAWKNYYKEFPTLFPCLLAELTGIAVDRKRLEAEYSRFSFSVEKQLAGLRAMTGTNNFNPSSPQQVGRLFEVLGSGDIKSSDAKNIDRVADRHSLNKRVVSAIKKYREDRKMASTYLRDENPKTGKKMLWHDRYFYSISPSKTDTGRLASNESAFWCGQNMQNWPRDREDIEVKNIFVSDPGFLFGECDYAQNEARGTAYLSGDITLINAVDDTTKDFHGINASRFFGIPYEKIVVSTLDDSSKEYTHKTIDKDLRNNIGKRINHGANYNMGPQVMLDTMGIANVRRAKQLLQFPSNWSLVRVCAELLALFDRAYPVTRGAWYEKCIADVVGSGFLVGPTGWTRRCFGNPKTNKHWLNAYVAHPPQSLAAMQLNIAYIRVFCIVAIVEARDFKLGPQIHDSILFQYRKGREDLLWKVADCMKVPIEVTDTFGKKRLLVVPTDVKGDATRWSEVKAMKRSLLVAA